VCPDLPTSPGSLDFSLSWMERLPTCLPWYLSLQDGMSLERVDAEVGRFSGLFIGGSDDYKMTAWFWVGRAREQGIPCHYARASTARKRSHAMRCGCDSFDTSFPLWTASRFALFLREHDRNYQDGQLRFWSDRRPL
jgi:hypothetical protein